MGPPSAHVKCSASQSFLRARHLQQLSLSLSYSLLPPALFTTLSAAHFRLSRESRSSRKINFPCPDSLLLFFFFGGRGGFPLIRSALLKWCTIAWEINYSRRERERDSRWPGVAALHSRSICYTLFQPLTGIFSIVVVLRGVISKNSYICVLLLGTVWMSIERRWGKMMADRISYFTLSFVAGNDQLIFHRSSGRITVCVIACWLLLHLPL